MTGHGSDGAAGVAAQLIDALGAAWSTAQLYPTPTDQPIFQRSMEALGAAAYPAAFQIGPGVFMVGSDEIDGVRDGADRLAKRLFIHDIATMEMVGKPAPTELLTFFEILEAEEHELTAQGGPQAVLAGSGVTSIRLVDRFVAAGAGEEGQERSRHPELEELLAYGSNPQEFAQRLAAEYAGNSSGLLNRFIDWYGDIYTRVEPTDVGGREEVVRIFVESFFFLPADLQPALLGRFLTRRGEERYQVFLDQFAGHELAGFAEGLDLTSREMLMEYARVSTDAADGRPEELLALLQSADEVKSARRMVAERVGERLRDTSSVDASGELFSSLKAQIPNAESDVDVGMFVMRDLLMVEEREPRFRRVLRIWGGRVALAVRNGDLARANRWMRAVLDEPPYPEEYQPTVEQAMLQMASADVLESLVAAMQDEETTALGMELLGAWGSSATERLVERLADEEDAGRRRVLIELLSVMGQQAPGPLLPYLDDQRWFVVRNLATVLGRTGRREAVPRLRRHLRHRDHRVRIEVLRALIPLLGADALPPVLAAMKDEHERVRRAALALLRASEDDRADALMTEALDDMEISLDERCRLVEVLGDRRSPVGIGRLEELAKKKIAFGAQARQLRAAARSALGRSR